MQIKRLFGVPLIPMAGCPAVRIAHPIDKSKIYYSEGDPLPDAVDYYNDIVCPSPYFSWTHLFEIQRLAEGFPKDDDLLDRKLFCARNYKQRLEMSPILLFRGNVIDAINSRVWTKHRAIAFASSIYKEIGSTFFIGMDGFQGEDGFSRGVEGHHRTAWIAMNHFLGNNGYPHMFFNDWNEVNDVVSNDNNITGFLKQRI